LISENSSTGNTKREEVLMSNLAIQSFGEDFVVDFIWKFYNTYKLPFVSVGSGSAEIEHKTKLAHPEVEWICVDPDPLDWATHGREKKARQVFIDPVCGTVGELVTKKPELVGKCIVFLNWCFPNESTYDIRSVELLDPIAFLTTIEKFMGGNGAAGGALFHAYIDACDDTSPYEGKKHHASVHTTSLLPCPSWPDHVNDVRISWYQNSKLSKVSHDLPNEVVSKIPHYDKCNIM
jgi:hypothetical protein